MEIFSGKENTFCEIDYLFNTIHLKIKLCIKNAIFVLYCFEKVFFVAFLVEKIILKRSPLSSK